MDTFTIYGNGRIRCTFSTAKRLCFLAFSAEYVKWLNEDKNQVPESEHGQIEEFFFNALQFLISIQNDANDVFNFYLFDLKLKIIADTIDALKP
jgi:hypothetical protein